MTPLEHLAKKVNLPNLIVHYTTNKEGELSKVFLLLDRGFGGCVVKQQLMGHWCGYALAKEGKAPKDNITYVGRSLHDWREVKVAFPHAELPDLEAPRWYGYESKLDFSPDLIEELLTHIVKYSR